MVDISLEVFSIEMTKLVSVMVLKLLNIFYGMMWLIVVLEVVLTDDYVSLTWVMMLTMMRCMMVIDIVPMMITVMLVIVNMMAIVMMLPGC